MALPPGTLVGVYEVVSLIGAGGMGEVYRARDSRLQREVAIKVLPAIFAADGDRVARFQREAHVLASLNHSNIAAVYGLEDVKGAGGDVGRPVSALVMELVDGSTLADRIAQGRLPLDEALPVARQIAEALEAAHEHGIIHRDLKPANIKVRPDGTVKVLDFGLAKALDPMEGGSAALSMSPTLTSPAATGLGIVLGTAAYMAPEQAKGKRVDKRADMWAFGCVLFEMLTGRRAFDGEEMSETLAEVIKGEPKWDALPSDTPAAVRRLLRRCLVKDPKARLSDAAVARIEIDEALNPALQEQGLVREKGLGWRRLLSYAGVAAAAAAVTLAAAWMFVQRDPASPEPMRFTVTLPGNVQLAPNAVQRLTISSDGRRIVYPGTESGVTRLYVRTVDQLDSVPIRGVDRIGSIFLSPDGEWVGYNDTVTGAFRKVPVGGGPAATICDVPSATGGFRGASWGTGGRIVFATGAAPGLMQVADVGGTPEPLTSPGEGELHRDPYFLPDGRTVLFVVVRPKEPDQIAAVTLDSPQPRILMAGNNPKYVSTGHLVFLREGALWATAFDAGRRAVVGNAAPVLEGFDATAQLARYDVSQTGTLVYSPSGGQSTRTLVWVDREGREEVLPAPPRAYVTTRLSPDATRIAVAIADQEDDIWVWDLSGQTLTRMTFDRGVDSDPIWTPDNRRIAWRSNRDGPGNLFWRVADGTGAEEQLTKGTNGQTPTAFVPDGSQLLFYVNAAGQTLFDIMRLDIAGGRKIDPLVQTQFFELNAELSPDGRWVAYQSRESGTDQIFVRPFPDVQAGRWQVSTGGGLHPVWSRNGREIVYLDSTGKLTSVAMNTVSGITAGAPQTILQKTYFIVPGTNAPRGYDVAPDGRRFLMIKEDAANDAEAPHVVVVLNWLEELKRRVAVD